MLSTLLVRAEFLRGISAPQILVVAVKLYDGRVGVREGGHPVNGFGPGDDLRRYSLGFESLFHKPIKIGSQDDPDQTSFHQFRDGVVRPARNLDALITFLVGRLEESGE